MTHPLSRVYLDCNATAPLRPAVRDAMLDAMGRAGNASSVHAEGRAARAAVEGARRSVAALFGAAPDGVIFTAGATEAAALALTPHMRWSGGRASRLILGATEHPAVSRGHRFDPGAVTTIPVDRNGTIDLGALAAALDRAGPSVLALQAANSETGVLQPVAEAADLVHRAGGIVVCDVAQAAGRIDCAPSALKADVLLVSAHKMGGPAGAGAMVMLRPDLVIEAPLMVGGGQERGLRGGTENRVGIVGFGVAAALVAGAPEAEGLRALRDRLEESLREIAPDAVVFGASVARLPNTVAFAVPGIANDAALIALDLAGIAVSTGSACASGKVSPSQVLEAMGIDAHLRSGLVRVSLGWSSTRADVERFTAAFSAIMHRMRGSPARSAA